MKPTEILKLTYIVGGILSFTGALLAIFNFTFAVYPFTVGAVCIIYFHGTSAFSPTNVDFRTERLLRISFLISLLMGVASYFMYTNSNLWVPAVLAYSLVNLFLSFRK